MIQYPVPKQADKIDEQQHAEKSAEIAYEYGLPELPRLRHLFLPKPYEPKQNSYKNSYRKALQEIPRICVKEEILECHVFRK